MHEEAYEVPKAAAAIGRARAEVGRSWQWAPRSFARSSVDEERRLWGSGRHDFSFARRIGSKSSITLCDELPYPPGRRYSL